MRRRTTCFIIAGFFLGLATGLYVQHRWPLGRLRARFETPRPLATATITPADLAALPESRRLVIVVSGQSNAANYGSVRAHAGPGVHVFHDGALYQAADPLPGGDQTGGSVWTRLGARLMITGDYDAVVFCLAAAGSTRVSEWAPDGTHHPRLETSLQQLASVGLTPDLFLWQQGESEAWDPTFPGLRYANSLEQLLSSVRRSAPGVACFVALSTYGAHATGNAQIRSAQRAAPKLPDTFPGPDIDSLTAACRKDGVHLNEAGLETAADLWLAALQPVLSAHRRR